MGDGNAAVRVLWEEARQRRLRWRQRNPVLIEGRLMQAFAHPADEFLDRTEHLDQLAGVEKPGWLREAGRRCVARPGPIRGSVTQSSTHWVQRQVARELEQVLVVGDQARSEAALKEMTGPVVSLVEGLCHAHAQVVHRARKIPELGCEEKV